MAEFRFETDSENEAAIVLDRYVKDSKASANMVSTASFNRNVDVVTILEDSSKITVRCDNNGRYSVTK